MDVALSLGSSVLSAFLGFLFDRMDKPEFLDLFRRHKYDVSILEKLKWKLLILQAVLEDAESKQTKNLAVKMWLDQLQEIFYQADDLLDQIDTEALRVKVESQYAGSAINKVSTSTEPSNFSIEFLKGIMPELEEIVHKLDQFEQKIGILGLVKEVEPKKQQFRRPSTSLVHNDECGRDDDKEKIIKDLHSVVGNCANFNVISIVGLGGVGKTTLAKLVYNDDRVNRKFDIKAWVCISEEYDAIRITKSLLNELNISCSDPNETFNSLQLKLKEGLSKKKFLLVMDDIWNRNYDDWLALSAPFSGGKEGSKIILTTRDEKIALMIGNQHIHHLNPLSEEHCWCLFKSHALNNRDGTGMLEFELIGKEMVKKCGGLPLAIKAIAGLLRSKETIEEWNEILISDEWHPSKNQAGILPSLRITYIHLPSHLKRCFGYCAVFHKDYQFSKDEVIQLWMANDLLESPPRNKRLEDVADEYFRELRFRCLFQQSSHGKFFMHDLVNDLAKSISGENFFRLEDHRQTNSSLTLVRHFSYINDYYDVFEKFKPINQSLFLRTFLPVEFNLEVHGRRKLSQKFLLDILSTFRSLRVLSLSGYEITELSNSLSNLKQLRYMDLSYTRIGRLPSWICRFYNLQTLLLASCKYLNEFPEDMEKLLNLRYLDISGISLTNMPLRIGRLEHLQFLSTFVVSKGNDSRIEELGRHHNLHGELSISGLENVANGKSASMAKMKEKKYIEKLILDWNGDIKDSQVVRGVLENLQPHTNIEHLEIRGYCGTRFPDWLQDTSYCHIRNLHISMCQNCFCLPAIGQLPALKVLRMSGLSNVVEMGQAIYESRNSFPCLEELYIKSCPFLTEGIPKQIPSLKKLLISRCQGLVNTDGELTIFDSKADFSSLRELDIRSIPNLKELSSSKDLNKLLPCLEKLKIVGCQDIVSFSIDCLPTTLKLLRISDCGNLELETCEESSVDSIRFSGSIKNLSLSLIPKLQHVFIDSVKNFKELSVTQGNQNLISLLSLEIIKCDNFVSFPVQGIHAPYLTKINLKRCHKLKALPERMYTLLPSLQHLTIDDCPEIECFPKGGLPSSLKFIHIGSCGRLWSCHGQWGLHRLPSLTKLSLKGIHQLETWPSEDFLLPSTLATISLEGHQNMKMLSSGILQNLTCLQSLYITGCPKLQSLPEGLPTSLSELIISDCTLLKQRLEWEKGEDWHKVSHICCILVDRELIP